MFIPQGDQPDISIQIQSVADNVNSDNIPLSAISSSVTANEFTSLLINFSNLPGTGSVLVSAFRLPRTEE